MAMFAVGNSVSRENRKRSTNEKEQIGGKKCRPNESANGNTERTGDYKPPPCVICKGAHPLYKCDAFIKLLINRAKKDC